MENFNLDLLINLGIFDEAQPVDGISNFAVASVSSGSPLTLLTDSFSVITFFIGSV